jgi:mRNA interferase RelE/StbE
MEKYRISIKKSAAKELEAMPKKNLQRNIKHIQALADNPRLPGSQKLSGKELYRIRQGDYRIAYSIEDKDSLIDIFKIGHRREIYRS